jgi:beta-lactamase regulating signal transducer with metallopeptidase domain
MTPNSFSVLWTSFAPRLGNHLWQSTLFAVVAGLLAFALRKNHAQARYWLWLSASVKFLFPFSLLVGIGSGLAWSRGSAEAKTGLYLAMKGFSQPFTQPIVPMFSEAAQLGVARSLVNWLPMLVVTVWLCGFLLVLGLWFVRWRRISAVAREAITSCEGREVEILRRVERTKRIKKPTEMRMSRTSIEPGIFGIFRPVLVWPNGMPHGLGIRTWRQYLLTNSCMYVGVTI